MNTRTITACRVVSALVFTVATSTALPATTAYAASKSETATAASCRTEPKKNGKGQAQPRGQEKKQEADKPVTAPQQSETKATKQPPTKTAPVATANNETSSQKTNNPTGNNGFIKVNEEVVSDSIPNNDPHVSCSFKVEFYNYDMNPSYRAKVSFALQNPTAGDGYSIKAAGNLNPFIGQDGAGGGNDLDAVETYRLTFTGKPHPTQGYHVKLTISADGSRGADVKHKVFWVQPCKASVAPAAVQTTAPQSTPPAAPALSETTPSVPARSETPARIPATGAGIAGIALSLLAAAGSYAAALRIQRLRASGL